MEMDPVFALTGTRQRDDEPYLLEPSCYVVLKFVGKKQLLPIP